MIRAEASRNLLLARLSTRDRLSLLPECGPVQLQAGARVMIAGQKITHVHFPIDCVISLLSESADRPLLEIGLIGCEGMLGVPLVLGATHSNTGGFVQAPGLAWRVAAARFMRCVDASAPLRRRMQHYLQAHMTQLSEAAACKHFHSLSERLARWLLLSADRSQSNELALTHAYLALMLGVRRAGITQAARGLQDLGLIEYSRGKISLLDRGGLEAASCPCYAREQDLRAQLKR